MIKIDTYGELVLALEKDGYTDDEAKREIRDFLWENDRLPFDRKELLRFMLDKLEES